MAEGSSRAGMAKVRARRGARRKLGAASAVPNRLYYGDNFDILRDRDRIPSQSVDLIYLDPPFKSNQDYNVLFQDRSGQHSAAQIRAFEDTWTWDDVADATFQETLAEGAEIADTLVALRSILGESDMMAYLAMMAPRLLDMRRVLKESGSLYLHCDPTASHYLKVLMDAVFGGGNFENEIIWKRTSGHSDATRYGRVHDVLLFYSRDAQRRKWIQTFQKYEPAYVEQYYRYQDADGRRFMSGDLSAAGLQGGGYEYEWKGVKRVWRCPVETMKAYDRDGRIYYTRNGIPRIKRYLDESSGMPVQDVWTDVEALRSWHAERLGYPTQKPVALLERLIAASSQEGDVVLDPFCGCGTTIAAAHKLNRRWIGIDIAYFAVDLIQRRLIETFGPEVKATYDTDGVPRDLDGARALFERNPFDFEVWAVLSVDGQPNNKQIGDRGADGRIRFPLDGKAIGTSVVSVKGGEQINPSMVRDLIGSVSNANAQMGVLVLFNEPTRGMTEAARAAGGYVWPVNGRRFPKIQIITVAEILAGKRLDMPTPFAPHTKAKFTKGEQMDLLGAAESA